MSTSRDAAFASASIRMVIFTAASLIVTGGLVMIMGNLGGGDQTTYKAVFSSASELVPGSSVRVAGVQVGKVTDVEFHGTSNALVTFEVDSGVPLTQESRASVRFLNLVGDRYMTLEAGEGGGPRLAPEGTIPISHTTPALNLTALFNGFQPLFQALRPEDVNTLAFNLVKVLQGEGGTIQEMLANTASLTNALADRDQLIGDVINNLNELMVTVDDHHEELSDLIKALRAWFGDLADDRKTIGGSLDNISDLSETVADLLTRSRPLIKKDVAELRRVLTILNDPENRAQLDEALVLLPDMLAKQTRIGTYGSWYNYYLCEFIGGVILPEPLWSSLPEDVQLSLSEFHLVSKAERCKHGLSE
ncbi:MAG TPA: MCE family protein [Aeromicrobium sp.]|nr:MCE family protein [Aeromicrobium sp.]